MSNGVAPYCGGTISSASSLFSEAAGIATGLPPLVRNAG